MKTMLSASRKSLSGLMDKTSGDQVQNSSTLFGFVGDMFLWGLMVSIGP